MIDIGLIGDLYVFVLAGFLGYQVISRVSPPGARVGRTVTLTGADFAGANSVTFRGVEASFQVVSDTQITAKVPDGALSGPITVTTPSLGTGTSSFDFRVEPSIEGFSPRSGPVGTTVVITGFAFTGAIVVKFHGVAATFRVNSYHQITAIVPAGATTGRITVVTLGGSVRSRHSFVVT